MKVSVDVCLVVFESGDYVLLGHSKSNDVELMDLATQYAPPTYGRPLMTYLDQLCFEDSYLEDRTGWRYPRTPNEPAHRLTNGGKCGGKCCCKTL